MIDETRLPALLTRLAEDVDAPPMSRAAWEGARRVRRRRRLVAAAAALAVVGAVGVSIPFGSSDRPPPAGEARPPESPAEPRVQQAPDRAAVDALPLQRGPLEVLDELPGTAPPLAPGAVSRVFVAAQRDGGPVLVSGDDGAWHRVDGVDGTLTATSVSPDGTRLALARPGAVVIVDVRTGESRTLAVTGAVAESVQQIVWLGDGEHVVVGGDFGDAVLSTADGSQRTTFYRAFRMAAGQPGRQAIEVFGTGQAVDRGGESPARVLLQDSGAVELEQWYGGAWASDGRVAATGFRANDAEQFVAVIDAGTGRVTHLLGLSYEGGRSQGCCATLGWLASDIVVLRDGARILGWRPDTGELLRLARLPGTDDENVTLALRP